VIEEPLLGYGIGISRHLPIPEDLSLLYKYFTVPTTHPHNAPIQIWLELGLIGVVIMLLLIGFASSPIRRTKGRFRVAAFATGVSIIFTGFVSYGFWQETWLSIIGMAVILFKLIHQVVPDGNVRVN
jgi:O-antigen ligase